MLQSPDGNWIALHSSQLSRPSLLTKRKSLVFSVLEKESGVISAYDEMGSDSEQGDEGGWGAALRQFRRKLSDETYYTDSQHDPEWTYTQHLPITSPSSGQYTNTETVNSDSEASSVPSACPRNAPPNPLRKKGLSDTHLHPRQPLYQQHLHQNLHPYAHPCEALDVNFNPKVAVPVLPCLIFGSPLTQIRCDGFDSRWRETAARPRRDRAIRSKGRGAAGKASENPQNRSAGRATRSPPARQYR